MQCPRGSPRLSPRERSGRERIPALSLAEGSQGWEAAPLMTTKIRKGQHVCSPRALPCPPCRHRTSVQES